MEMSFKIKGEKESPTYGEFIIEPLEPGFGHTVGNALRRVLLSSIPGYSVTSVKISGVKHKFSTVPGLKENVVDFLLNLKGVNFKLSDSKETGTVRLSVKGPAEITAKDLEMEDGVEVLNKDHYLGSLSDKKSKLEMELTIEKGFGFSPSDERKINTVGVISTDAVFSPVRRVNYTVSATRVGRTTNLDKLVLQITTNGAISPKESLTFAAKILSSYFLQIYEPKGNLTPIEGISVTSSVADDILKLTVDELDLPTRIYNSLRNGGIETLGQLLETSRKDLLSMRNMGGKSISIIEEKLKEKGVSLSV